MAHLLEHVAYMGSPKRQLISGTGSRTNAYTDFHHTVFYAACPVQTPDQFWKKPMLPMALDALVDVMTTRVDDERLEKERAAVLSEASMVNKMEYRVECQVLSALHTENRISIRFPIGKENLIKVWTKEDVQFYHNLHYRPDNVILYVVGDIDVDNTIETIKQKFGQMQPKVETNKIIRDSGEYPVVSMKDVNRHFPPVVHRWSTAEVKLMHSHLSATKSNIDIFWGLFYLLFHFFIFVRLFFSSVLLRFAEYIAMPFMSQFLFDLLRLLPLPFHYDPPLIPFLLPLHHLHLHLLFTAFGRNSFPLLSRWTS